MARLKQTRAQLHNRANKNFYNGVFASGIGLGMATFSGPGWGGAAFKVLGLGLAALGAGVAGLGYSEGRRAARLDRIARHGAGMDARARIKALMAGGKAGPGAYLNGAAKAKAGKAPTPRAAPAARPPGGGKANRAGGKQSYTTADGRTVSGTAGQVAAWRGRRK